MYDLYKPLRNRLRSYSLLPSLRAIYQLIQFRQFNKPLPPALRYPGFGLRRPLEIGLHEWTLETIARELILNAPRTGSRDMSSWNEFATVANLVRDLENNIWGRLPNGNELIRYEVVRIAHRQFPWQVKPNSRLIASYFKLYDNDRLSELIHATYGMSAVEFYQISLAIMGHFFDTPLLRLPLVNRINNVQPETVASFMARFALPLDLLRDQIRETQAYNINWAYSFDPLRSWPMIAVEEDHLFCPMPTLLTWRLTEGVYFDLVRDRVPFDRNFGPAFQDLVGEVLRRADRQAKLQVLPEQRYGSRKRPRDSVDVIVLDGTASVFVECKASRLKAQAKVDLNDTAAIDAELNRLAGFVVQTYSTLADALNGGYPHWRPDGRPVYPMVVTLDEWVPSGRGFLGVLDQAIRDGLQRRGLRAQMLEEHPYTICSLHEFEAAAIAFDVASLDEVMSAKTRGEHHTWALQPFLQRFYPHQSDDPRILFDAEWRALATSHRRAAEGPVTVTGASG